MLFLVPQEIQTETAKLREELENHNYFYYVLDQPQISDAAYDNLMRKLQQLEESYPELIVPESPTQRVGGKVAAQFLPIKHKVPLLSLANAYNEDDLSLFEERLKRILPEERYTYTVELKIDGLTVALIYRDGFLITGATRGDGESGEDVTQNVRTITSIPLRLRENLSIVVRGEVFMTKQDLMDLNTQREKMQEELFANPRNAAAGSLRQLDPKII